MHGCHQHITCYFLVLLLVPFAAISSEHARAGTLRFPTARPHHHLLSRDSVCRNMLRVYDAVMNYHYYVALWLCAGLPTSQGSSDLALPRSLIISGIPSTRCSTCKLPSYATPEELK